MAPRLALTPALSPWERENRSPLFRESGPAIFHGVRRSGASIRCPSGADECRALRGRIEIWGPLPGAAARLRGSFRLRQGYGRTGRRALPWACTLHAFVLSPEVPRRG